MTNGEQGIKCYTPQKKKSKQPDREKELYYAFAWAFRCETSA